jgi:Transposase DDE domain group 1
VVEKARLVAGIERAAPSRKPKVFYHSFRYRAGSWECARRVVAKVEWHAGELFPRVGFIVTNLK